MEEKYNGWHNYETWCVKLWIDNEEGSYRYWQERAEEIRREARDNPRKSGVWTAEEEAKFTLEDALSDWVNENKPEAEGMYSDLLQSAIDAADYQEIAEAMLADLPEEEEEEEDDEEEEGV